MQELNLTATTLEQTRIKEYLELNASDTLAEKINNGVIIEKEGKALLNKKDLNSFMKYACDEARKQADKGATSACIDDATVFGWAIHYFEEDIIEGTLYNEDGTEYKVKPSVTVGKLKSKVKTERTQSKQFSLFDISEDTAPEPMTTEAQNDNSTEINGTVVGSETGEVSEERKDSKSEEIIFCLQALFGNLIIKR